MRKGLLRRVHPRDAQAGQLEQNVCDAFDATADDVNSAALPVTRLSASAPVPAGAALAVFSGGPGCKLTLPAAAAQGPNVGAVVHLLNLATVAVTLATGSADTLNGGATLSLAAGKLAICVSDGVHTWKAVTS